jgi:menaquinone-dependent protoporphyrinogen oxidase
MSAAQRAQDRQRGLKVANILLVYSTTDGHTVKICTRLKQVIEADAHRVALVSVDEGLKLDISSFDKIAIGASIRYGKHGKQVHRFIDVNQSILSIKPNAFFTVNVVARKPEKSAPGTNPYLKKFLARITWKPKVLGVFAGRIDYSLYRLRDRLAIRLIMWMTNGPTDLKTAVEFTDWNAVDDFGRAISRM